MKKILFCDIDSTINNHWVRIQKWSSSDPNNNIHWKAFTAKELMQDRPLPNSKESLKELSKYYSINFLTARGFNRYNKWRIFSEKYYDTFFGLFALKVNNFLSIIWAKIFSKETTIEAKYAYPITQEWLNKNGFIYDSLIVVDSMDDKVKILNNIQCDLFIDDMSWGQKDNGSYVNLYDNAIIKLDEININYEIFNEENNWIKIVKKYSR